MSSRDPSTGDDSGVRRLLVVAAETVGGPELRQAVAEHAGGGRAEVRLIAPALTSSALEHALGEVDEASKRARSRLEVSVAELEQAGIVPVGAEVGDEDLRLAIQDALATFDADEILIVAHREGGPRLERQWIAEAERDFDPPITELFVERDPSGEEHIADVHSVGPGHAEADPGEREGRSGNLPPFSPRDVVGIAVAIIGTVILVVLAASGSDDLSGLSSQSVRILLAGALGLINLAHVVGLTLIQTGPYGGGSRDFFARVSLYGTPAAIVLSLLLLAL